MSNKDMKNQPEGSFPDIVPEPEGGKGQAPLEGAIAGPAEVVKAEPVAAKAPPISESKMNVLRNLKLKPKLIGSFVVVALVAGILAYVGAQFAFERIAQDAIPTLKIVAQVAELARIAQAETLEFASTGEESTVEELDQTVSELSAASEQLGTDFADDPGEGVIFEGLADQAQTLTDLAQEIIQSHSQTLEFLEKFEELENEAEPILVSARNVIADEIERNLQAGDLDELREDAFPAQESLNEFIATLQLMQLETLEFVATGEEATIQEFEQATEQLKAARENLVATLEADEPGEADLMEQLDDVEEQVRAQGRAIIASHADTLELLEDLEDVEKDLGEAIVASQQLAQQDVNVGLAEANRNSIVVSLVTLTLATFLGILMGNAIVRPVSRLVGAAERIRSGDLNVVADVRSGDEIGVLATVFNSMTARLRELVGGLEQRVAERTSVLELAAGVGQRLSTVRDLDTLLAEAVEMIQNSFNLYHAQVYLTDPAERHLTLRASTGEVGAELLRRSHSLLVDANSINGRAATEKRAVVVSDTAQSPSFMPNPLLPDTRSEAAVPLLIGERVVGVLDLQSVEPGALTEDRLTAFEALAGQFAVAIDNAQLFNESAQARAEVEAQARRLAGESWEGFMDGIHRSERMGYTYEQGNLEPASEPITEVAESHVLTVPVQVQDAPVGTIQIEGDAGQVWTEAEAELVASVARQVAQQAENLRLLAQAEQFRADAEQVTRRLTREGWQAYLESQTEQHTGFAYDLFQVKPLADGDDAHTPTTSALIRPLEIRGETIGELVIDEADGLNEEATELVDTVTERLSAHIESLRLQEETERRGYELEERGQELEASQRVTFAAAETTDPDVLLDLVVDLIRDQFDLYHVQVYLADQEKNAAVLRKSTGYAGQQLLERGHQIPLDRPSLVTRAINDGEPVVVNDVNQDENWLPNPLLPNTQSELVLPLRTGDGIIGALDVQARTPERFTPALTALFQTMAEQVAMTFANAELLIRTQQQTEVLTQFTTQLNTAADVTERVSAILDPDELLNEVVTLLQQRFGLYHAHIYLLDGETLKMQTGSGEIGQILLERGHNIPLDREHSLVARAARMRQIVTVNDTTLDADFMPNPLLPQTRSEMAVPLIASGQVLGVLDVQDNQPDRFGPTDQDTFSTLAGQIATALDNARLFEEQKRVEQALTESEEEFRTLYEATGDAVMLLDDKSFFDCNQATLKVFGCETRDQFVGKHPGEFSPEYQPNGQDSGSLSAQRIETALREGSNFFEWQHTQLDGTEFPAEVLLTAMEIRGRQVLQAVVRDITERKQAEEETRIRFEISQTLAGAQTEEDVLDAMVQVAGFDPAVQVVLATYDQAAEEPTLVVRRVSSFEGNVAPVKVGSRFPASRFQIIGQFSPGAPLVVSNMLTDERVDPAARQFLSGLGVVSTAIITIAIGDERIGVLRASSSEEGFFDEHKLYLYQSLTEQGAVTLYTARLFDEIQQAADQLREMDGLKSEFLANMSHELRTPLNSIIGYTQLLLMDLEGEIPGESFEDMQAIETNSQHLLNLINDILDLAKIEAGRLELNKEEVEIEALLDTVRNNNAGLFIDSDLTFSVEVEEALPTIQADHIRITQVLNNLISNAVKFTEEGGVTVRAFRENDNVCISVADAGIGISQEDLDTIFERFRQVDGSYARRAEGTGLGLPITRHLVEMHAGTLDVQSTLGEGSVFTVRLPIHTEETVEVNA